MQNILRHGSSQVAVADLAAQRQIGNTCVFSMVAIWYRTRWRPLQVQSQTHRQSCSCPPLLHSVMLDSLRGSSVKIGTVQRRLAWPPRKDDAHKSRSVNISFVFPWLRLLTCLSGPAAGTRRRPIALSVAMFRVSWAWADVPKRASGRSLPGDALIGAAHKRMMMRRRGSNPRP